MEQPLVTNYPLAVTGGTTRVLEAGTGDDHVVLLHGVGARADRWRANLGPLAAAGFHVHALDFPGHGFAGKGSGVPCSVPALVAFVEEVLDELGIRAAHLVGTSLGGHVAARIAVKTPQRLRSLVLIGPTGIVPVGATGRAAMATAVVNTGRDGIRGKLHALVHDPALVTEQWVHEEWRVNNSPGAQDALAGYATYFAERLDDDVVGPALRGLDPSRVLLVWGAADVLVPASLAPAVRAALPDGARFVPVERTGHAPYLERPDRVNAELVAFLGPVGPTHRPPLERSAP